MKTHSCSSILVTTLFAMAIPASVLAQERSQVPDSATGKEVPAKQHHHYKLIDIGTFGGPSSYVSFPLSTNVMNKNGTVAGWADTPAADSFPFPFCFNPDCFVSHALKWDSGVSTDLGSLADGWSSMTSWINNRGDIVGGSQNGVIDPVVGFPEERAVLWHDGQMIDLRTLGGNQSSAAAINNHGRVAGFALSDVPDPFSMYYQFLYCLPFLICPPNATAARAFVWDEKDGMQDIGTLGGPDSQAFFVNDRGQVAGFSYTNSTVNATTGLPTFHPFLWEKGQGMKDLGTLGGTVAQAVNGLNERGEVVGSTTMAGDLTHHPFLWDGKQLIDLGTFGGPNGEADWVNDDGEVVGIAQLPEFCPVGPGLAGGGRAFLWRHGVLIDLGTTAGVDNSEAVYINSKTQVVGYSFACDFSTIDAFLWENDSIVDLNALTLPNSGLQLVFAPFIDDKGEIIGLGLLPSGDLHAVLLIPCDEGHPKLEGCDYSLVEAAPAAQRPAAADQSHEVPKALLQNLGVRRPGIRRP
jgi:probable HAF family extracellular repeat protein